MLKGIYTPQFRTILNRKGTILLDFPKEKLYNVNYTILGVHKSHDHNDKYHHQRL